MTQPVTASRRNAGMDFLRLLASLMIIMHHLISYGGLGAMFPPLSRSDLFYQGLNIFAYCGVNLFGLLTGYTAVGRRWRLSRLVELWIQIVFTGVVVMIGYRLLSGTAFTRRDWLYFLFPVSHNTYWYFNAYLVMYLLLPLIQPGLEAVSKRTYTLTLLALCLVLTVLPLFSKEDIFRTVVGYHAIWLLVLYLTGFYLRRFGTPKMAKWALPVFIVCMAVAFFSRILLEWLRMQGRTQLDVSLLEKYTSPTLYIGSAALVLWFAHLPLPERAGKLLSRLSPLAFGVYLIHGHDLLYQNLLNYCFVPYGGLPGPALLLLFTGVVLGVFLACLLLDSLRLALFRLIRLHEGLIWLENKASRWWEDS